MVAILSLPQCVYENLWIVKYFYCILLIPMVALVTEIFMSVMAAIFKCIFLNESIWISIEISLKFVPKSPINNIPAWVQIMAWHRPGDKPLSEPMLVCLLTHICVTRPQWVKKNSVDKNAYGIYKLCKFSPSQADKWVFNADWDKTWGMSKYINVILPVKEVPL